MLILDVPAKALAEEEDSIRSVEKISDSGSWTVRQSWGKFRRLHGDRQGLADLRAAADRYRQINPAVRNADALLTPAGMYLQAGDEEQAKALLTQARSLLEADLADRPRHNSGLLIEVLFLLGDDEAAGRVLATLQSTAPRTLRGTRHPVFADLARARATKDAALAADAVATLKAMARGEGGYYTDFGPPNLWDLYEWALIAQAEITGTVPSQLREI